MNKRDIKTTARDFRKGLLGIGPPDGMCRMVSYSLQGFLSFLGVETELVEGEIVQPDFNVDHVWLKLPDGSILDATADQFTSPGGRKMPAVYMGERPDWYKVI